MSVEILTKNYEKFMQQAEKLCKTDNPSFLQELKKSPEDFIAAPASTRLDFVCAYPGGLIEHSLRVLSIMAKMRSIYDPENKIGVESILLVSLFHDIGKLGTEKISYYVENDSSWHREKLGQMYNVNEKIGHIPVSQLSIQFLLRNGFTLSQNEWYAISSIRDKATRDDTPVSGEPMLAVMLQHAVKLACIQGKSKQSATIIS